MQFIEVTNKFTGRISTYRVPRENAFTVLNFFRQCQSNEKACFVIERKADKENARDFKMGTGSAFSN